MFAWIRRLRARVRYRRFDAELRQEIETHRALLQRDFEARGLSASDARARVAQSLGNVTLARENARGVWLAPWLESLWQDARYGARSLSRSPSFTITAMLTMTIGIGLCTSMFTAFNAVGLKGWPVENADSLVLLKSEGGANDGRSGFTLEDLADFEHRATSLAVVAAYARGFQEVAIESAAQPGLVYGQFVTPGFFDSTGVRIAMGRNFRSDDDREGGFASVAIISDGLWQRMYAADPNVIGRTLLINKHAFTVIGVVREGFRGGQPYRDDVWMPLQAMRTLASNAGSAGWVFSAKGGGCCVQLLGRLAPGVTRARAAEQLTLLANQRGIMPGSRQVRITGTSMYDRLPVGQQVAVALVMLAATVIVLLLTGANIAHLQLARAMARAKEVRTRLALGAGRARIARQLVTEALLLAIVASGLGLLMVYAVIDTMMEVSEMVARDVWTPDATVLAYCVGITLVMSLTFSVLPAMRSTRVSLASGAGQAATRAGRMRFNLVLLTTQIACSAALLTGASLLTRGLTKAIQGDGQFAVEDVSVATFQPSRTGANVTPFTRTARETLTSAIAAASLPPTALMDTLPFIGFVRSSQVWPTDDGRRGLAVDLVPMSASAFRVLNLALVEGRSYVDDPDAAEVVLNEKAARALWPGNAALGKLLVHEKRTYTVVGVSRDVHFSSTTVIKPVLHLPAGMSGQSPFIVYRGGGPAVTAQVKAIVAGIDPGATVTVQSLVDRIAMRYVDERTGANAAWGGGLLALALATFGVFGVFAFVVEERRREIGIRVALGAQRSQVLGAVFRPARLAVLAGLGAGLLLSLAMGPLLSQALFGLSPFDPVSFGVVAMILASAGFLATFIPARRALALNPVVILKEDG